MGNSFTYRLTKVLVLCSVFYLFFIEVSYSQPDWVKDAITLARQSEVHDDASIIVLVNNHKLKISDDGKTERNVKRAVKLLKSSGIEYTRLYESKTSWRQIDDVKGWNVKADGEIGFLEKEYISEVASDISAGYYDDGMLYFAAFPDVNVGDIIAFEYTIKEKSNWDSYFQSYELQLQEPVLSANFEVEIPVGWELHDGSHFTDVCTYQQFDNKYIWIAENLKYRPTEELMPPWSYLKRYIEITCYNPQEQKGYNFASWKDAAIWSKQYMQDAVILDDQIKEYVNTNISSLNSTEEKLEAISDFVQDEIRYVAVEIGKGRFVPREAPKTFFNRYGDCKDKVALMRAMLSHIQIPSSAVLTSVSSFVDPRLPTPLQFDHCIVGIDINQINDIGEKPNATIDNWLLFDPTDQAQPLGELPTELYGSKILIAEVIDSSLKKIPYIDPENNHRKYMVEGILDAEGNMKSEIKIIDYGANSKSTAYYLATMERQDVIDAYREGILEYLPSAELTDFTFEQTADSTLIQFSIHQSDYLTKAGDLNFLGVDFIDEGRLPRLKNKERVHPIWFGNFKKLETDIKWSVDPSWKIELTQDTVDAECEVAKYTQIRSHSNNTLSVFSKYIVYGGLVDVENFEETRNFVREVSRGRNLKVSLNK